MSIPYTIFCIGLICDDLTRPVLDQELPAHGGDFLLCLEVTSIVLVRGMFRSARSSRRQICTSDNPHHGHESSEQTP